jgi:muconolactone delta-isomerase
LLGIRRAAHAGTSTRAPVAVFDVDDNEALHRILNEWADIIPAHFDTYPLIEADAAQRMLAAQAAASHG